MNRNRPRSRQLSYRLNDDLSEAIEHLEDVLPTKDLHLSQIGRTAAAEAIWNEVKRIYQLNNIPLPEQPITKEEKALAIIKETFPEAPESVCRSVMVRMKDAYLTP